MHAVLDYSFSIGVRVVFGMDDVLLGYRLCLRMVSAVPIVMLEDVYAGKK